MPNYTPKEMAVFLRRCADGVCDDSCPYCDVGKKTLMRDASEVLEEAAESLANAHRSIELEMKANADLRSENHRLLDEGWTPLDVQSPKDACFILVTDGHRVDSAGYDPEKEEFDCHHGFVDPNEVTAWQPWPEVRG